jgi:hypothetical protein
VEQQVVWVVAISAVAVPDRSRVSTTYLNFALTLAFGKLKRRAREILQPAATETAFATRAPKNARATMRHRNFVIVPECGKTALFVVQQHLFVMALVYAVSAKHKIKSATT